jgi:hypothetical protein
MKRFRLSALMLLIFIAAQVAARSSRPFRFDLIAKLRRLAFVSCRCQTGLHTTDGVAPMVRLPSSRTMTIAALLLVAVALWWISWRVGSPMMSAIRTFDVEGELKNLAGLPGAPITKKSRGQPAAPVVKNLQGPSVPPVFRVP